MRSDRQTPGRGPLTNRKKAKLQDLVMSFPTYQRVLLHMLRHQRDVTIVKLHHKLYGLDRGVDHRRMQQDLGRNFSRMNPKLAPLGYVIKPGVTRKTYRLWSLN